MPSQCAALVRRFAVVLRCPLSAANVHPSMHSHSGLTPSHLTTHAHSTPSHALAPSTPSSSHKPYPLPHTLRMSLTPLPLCAAARLLLGLTVQSLVQSVRHCVFDCLSLLWAAHPLSLREGGSEDELLEGFVSAVDGEKDPRCLVVVFALTAFLTRQCSPQTVQRHCEALFDVVGCYFPITFTPPMHDPHHITSEELRVGLRAALTSHPSMVPHLLPVLLDKAEDTASTLVQVDALRNLQALLDAAQQASGGLREQWRVALMPLLSDVQGAVKRLWVQTADIADAAEVREALAAALTSLMRLLCPDEEEDEGQMSGSDVSSLRSAVFSELVSELRVPDSKVAHAYAGMSAPIGAASHTALAEWSSHLFPAILHRYQHNQHATDTQRQVNAHTHRDRGGTGRSYPSASPSPPTSPTLHSSFSSCSRSALPSLGCRQALLEMSNQLLHLAATPPSRPHHTTTIASGRRHGQRSLTTKRPLHLFLSSLSLCPPVPTPCCASPPAADGGGCTGVAADAALLLLCCAAAAVC